MKVEPEELYANFRTSFFIFFIQMALVIFSSEILTSQNDEDDNMKVMNRVLKEGNELMIIAVRFICALALHLVTEGEVLQAINIIKLSIYKTSNWDKRHAMFMVGIMQLLGAIGTEALNIYQVCSTYNIKDIIMNFVQLGIIAQIDDLYAQSLKNNFFMKVLRESEIEISSTYEDKERSS